MDLLERTGRYLGGAISVAGLAFAAAFVGRRTADPVATAFVQPLTIWHQLLGVAAGIAVVVLGLWIVGLTGRFAGGTE
jgi:uncharacterized membrane protein